MSLTGGVQYYFRVRAYDNVGNLSSESVASSSWSADDTIYLTIAANTNNYNIHSALGSPASAVKVRVTINSGVIVGSTSTGAYSLTTAGLPSGSTVTIINNGSILGRGGAGGAAVCGMMYSGNPGGAGGPALQITVATTIQNNNVIGGGGGGGGSGGTGYDSFHCSGAGGTGAGSQGSATSGAAGTVGGCDSGTAVGGAGGNGGGLGSSGSSGAMGSNTPGCDGYGYGAGAGGGGGGAAVQGNSLVTWSVTGTRQGALNP